MTITHFLQYVIILNVKFKIKMTRSKQHEATPRLMTTEEGILYERLNVAVVVILVFRYLTRFRRTKQVGKQ